MFKRKINFTKPTFKHGMTRKTVLILSIVLLLVVAVDITLAYIYTNTNPVENVFTVSSPGSEIKENFVNKVKSDVYIENTGDFTAYIRVYLVATWVDAAGNVLSVIPVKGEDFTMTMADNTKWVLHDGYWYYTAPVKPKDKTDILIEECTVNEENEPEGYDLSIQILAQTIQAEPATAVQETWGVIITENSVTDVITVGD